MASSLDDTREKIAIFGATGNSGLQLVEQALERNYRVVALVRNPEGLKSANLANKHLEVKQFFKIIDNINCLNLDRSM